MAKNAMQPGQPDDSLVSAGGKSLRGLVSLDKASAKRDGITAAKADGIIGGFAVAASKYVAQELARFPGLDGDKRTEYLKAARKTFNAACVATLGKDAPLVKRDRLSKVHSVSEHPATAKYAAAWRADLYDAVIPTADGGDGKARFTLSGALAVITAANAAAKETAKPEDTFRKTLERLANAAADRTAFLQLARSIVDKMLESPTQPQPEPQPQPEAVKPEARRSRKPAKV